MRNTAAVSRSTRRKCFKWFLNIAETLETVKFARSNPETLAPGECLKQKQEWEGEEREERGISKRGPTEECQFLIGRYAARPLCRVCDPSEFWIPFHPVVRLNPRGILERFIQNRRTIRDKLVSRLEESLVNSSHRENCFQYCTVCNNIGCPKNVGTSVNWRSLRGIIFLCR